jgi:hypothetical protein
MPRKNPEVSMKSTKIKSFNWRKIVKTERRLNHYVTDLNDGSKQRRILKRQRSVLV